MKKIVIIFTALLYLFLTSGLSIHMHFCCGNLAEVQLTSFDDKCCDTDSEATPTISKSCCKFTQFDFELDDMQRKPGIVESMPVHQIDVQIQSKPDVVSNSNTHIEIEDTQNDPPPLELFKVHCSFVFYG